MTKSWHPYRHPHMLTLADAARKADETHDRDGFLKPRRVRRRMWAIVGILSRANPLIEDIPLIEAQEFAPDDGDDS